MKYADCAHCGRTVQEFSPGKWRHVTDTFFGSVGCRAASFDDNKNWDDSLDRRWKAKPKKGTEREPARATSDIKNTGKAILLYDFMDPTFIRLVRTIPGVADLGEG
jgi:hypothetical protein